MNYKMSKIDKENRLVKKFWICRFTSTSLAIFKFKKRL